MVARWLLDYPQLPLLVAFNYPVVGLAHETLHPHRLSIYPALQRSILTLSLACESVVV
jgi:hypothetical protein